MVFQWHHLHYLFSITNSESQLLFAEIEITIQYAIRHSNSESIRTGFFINFSNLMRWMSVVVRATNFGFSSLFFGLNSSTSSISSNFRTEVFTPTNCFAIGFLWNRTSWNVCFQFRLRVNSMELSIVPTDRLPMTTGTYAVSFQIYNRDLVFLNNSPSSIFHLSFLV